MIRFGIVLWLVALPCTIQTGLKKSSVCVKEEFHNDVPVASRATNYMDLVRYSDIFVDKSLQIKDILERPEKVIAINTPRKWGKTINLDMLKTFLQMDVDQNGTVTMPNETRAYQFFKHGEVFYNETGETRKLKNPPVISQYDHIINEYLANYPVIYIDFSNTAGRVLQIILYRISDAICYSFDRHFYAIKILEDRYKQIQVSYESQYNEERWELLGKAKSFRNMVFNFGYKEDAMIRSVNFLSEVLYKIFQKRVFVLIDEYDTPVNEVMFRKGDYLTDEEETVLDFFARFMKVSFHNNPYIEKTILTGVFSLANEIYFSKYKKVSPLNIASGGPFEYYGFTENDIHELFHHLNIPSELSQKARDWYRGYMMGTNKSPLYNPYSIVNFINTKKIDNYWAKSGFINFYHNWLRDEKFKNISQQLLEGKNITVNFNYFKYNDKEIWRVKHLVHLHWNHKFDDKAIDDLLTYLCAAGYLTFSDSISNTTKQPKKIKMRLPNKEIQHTLLNMTEIFHVEPNATIFR